MINFWNNKEIDQKSRDRIVFRSIIVIILLFITSIVCFFIYSNRNDKVFVRYNESSNIDYKVFLKDNNFFDNDYLESNKQYISSLLDSIVAEFNYKLTFEDKAIEYKYLYKIESTVNVIDKYTDNILYTNSELILEEKEFITTKKEVNIKEHININYDKYNNLISEFVTIYDLTDANSVLNINMYVKVIGMFDDKNNSDENVSIISLSIPLTTKTIGIDLSDNLVNNEDNILRCKSFDNSYLIALILGILFLCIGLILGVIIIIFVRSISIYPRFFRFFKPRVRC